MINRPNQKKATKQSQQDFLDRISEKLIFVDVTDEELKELLKRNQKHNN